MTADKSIGSHLILSNITYVDPWHPGTYGTDDLITNRVRPFSDFFKRQLRAAKHDHFIAYLHIRDLRYIQHHLIHTYSAHDRRRLAFDQHVARIREGTIYPIRITDRNRSYNAERAGRRKST